MDGYPVSQNVLSLRFIPLSEEFRDYCAALEGGYQSHYYEGAAVGVRRRAALLAFFTVVRISALFMYNTGVIQEDTSVVAGSLVLVFAAAVMLLSSYMPSLKHLTQWAWSGCAFIVGVALTFYSHPLPTEPLLCLSILLVFSGFQLQFLFAVGTSALLLIVGLAAYLPTVYTVWSMWLVSALIFIVIWGLCVQMCRMVESHCRIAFLLKEDVLDHMARYAALLETCPTPILTYRERDGRQDMCTLSMSNLLGLPQGDCKHVPDVLNARFRDVFLEPKSHPSRRSTKLAVGYWASSDLKVRDDTESDQHADLRVDVEPSEQEEEPSDEAEMDDVVMEMGPSKEGPSLKRGGLPFKRALSESSCIAHAMLNGCKSPVVAVVGTFCMRGVAYKVVAVSTHGAPNTEQEVVVKNKDAEVGAEQICDFCHRHSHDLKNLLDVFIGTMDLIKTTSCDPSYLNELMHHCETSIGSLYERLDDLVCFAKLHAGGLTLTTSTISTTNLLASVALAVSRDVKGRELVCLPDPDLPTTVAGDHAQLKRLLKEMVVNAIKCSDTDIELRASPYSPRSNKIVFEVIDKGCGIVPEELQGVFKSPLEAGADGGKGIGLFMCQKLAGLMGGEVRINTAVQVGTRVTCVVNLNGSRKNRLIRHLVGKNSPFLGCRVLIIDKSHVLLSAIRGLLQSWGCVADTVSSGEKALNKANRRNMTDSREGTMRAAYNLVLVSPAVEEDFAHFFPLLRKSALHRGTMSGSRSWSNASSGCALMLTEEEKRKFSRGPHLILSKPIVATALHELLIAALHSEAQLLRSNSSTMSDVRLNESTDTCAPLDTSAITSFKRSGPLSPLYIDSASEKRGLWSEETLSREISRGTSARDTLSRGTSAKYKILLCDDSTVNQELMSWHLNCLGYPFIVATNGQQALKIVQSTRIDLILMDVRMPVIDGIEATKRILQMKEAELYRLVIVGMSASVAGGENEKILEAGAHAFLEKPISRPHLNDVLNEWLILRMNQSSQSPMREEITPAKPPPSPGFHQGTLDDEDVHGSPSMVKWWQPGDESQVSVDSDVTVLVVDDNKLNLEIITGYALSVHKRCRILTALNGSQAVQAFEHVTSEGGSVSVILMDVHMPIMGGVEACQLIRSIETAAETSPTVIVGMSASIANKENQHLFSAGADEFLLKPVRATNFREVVGPALTGKFERKENSPPAKSTGLQQKPNVKGMQWTKGKLLGVGGHGSVYIAQDQETGKLMAVKEIHIIAGGQQQLEEQITELQKEVNLLQMLTHRHVVGFVDSEVKHTSPEAATLSMFLEYVPNGSLSAVVKKLGKLNEAAAATYCYQVLLGVEYLHSKRVVHRDIKCDNILVGTEGSVLVAKISDFGASKIKSASPVSTASVAGTPYFMSPETIAGKSSGYLCDIWSVGCTIIEMLTGHPPWNHLTPMQAIFTIGHTSEPPAIPQDVSEDVKEFMLKCFRINEHERPSATEALTHKWMERARNEYADSLGAC